MSSEEEPFISNEEELSDEEPTTSDEELSEDIDARVSRKAKAIKSGSRRREESEEENRDFFGDLWQLENLIDEAWRCDKIFSRLKRLLRNIHRFSAEEKKGLYIIIHKIFAFDFELRRRQNSTNTFRDRELERCYN